MNLSGAAIVVKSLVDLGVETVFGYPGGAIMPLYDALYGSPLHHVLTVHEQAAAHAADGYARACGRTGVCISTSGPGASNLVTGLATAFMDSSPVVAITGQVSSSLLGRDAFQEIDITSMAMPITKHTFLVRDATELQEIIVQAFSIATSGRPGPVLIDIPRDVLLAEAAFSDMPIIHNNNPPQPPRDQLSGAAKALCLAKRPVLLVGGGVIAAGAAQAARNFAEACGLPVVSTLMGLGSFPHDHPQFFGLAGMHGHKAANQILQEADVIVAAGTRFSDRLTGNPNRFAEGKTIIHLDIDPSEIGKNITTQIEVLGNLLHSLDALSRSAARFTFLAKAAPIHSECDEKLHADWIMRHLSGPDQQLTFVTDVGQNQMWAAQQLLLRQPRTWLTSGGLGTMGFGLPAALGAQLACPERRTVLIAGDGGFKMTGMELYTAASQNIPVIAVIINNRSLGMVRQWQQLFFDKRYSATLLPEFDFAALASACGVNASTANTPEEFSTAYAQALACNQPYVIVANIDREELVTPMVRPGGTLNQYVEA